jgi:hypothetical protein
MADRATATPTQLAEEIFKVVGDTDNNTAYFALDIARIILAHREAAQREFERKCSDEGSS